MGIDWKKFLRLAQAGGWGAIAGFAATMALTLALSLTVSDRPTRATTDRGNRGR